MIINNGLFEFDNELETKKCSICKESKPVTKFGRASGGNYYRGECKECGYELSKSRETARATAPPIPTNHTCPICNREEALVKGRGGKKSGTWCCDHDHATGAFRGWLCHDCNRGIGNMGDDITRLQKAMDYLKESLKKDEV